MRMLSKLTTRAFSRMKSAVGYGVGTCGMALSTCLLNMTTSPMITRGAASHTHACVCMSLHQRRGWSSSPRGPIYASPCSECQAPPLQNACQPGDGYYISEYMHIFESTSRCGPKQCGVKSDQHCQCSDLVLSHMCKHVSRTYQGVSCSALWVNMQPISRVICADLWE